MVGNYGHISRCDNIGAYMWVRACNIYARARARPFEKIFNDNRAHIRIRARERREIEEGGGTIVQYRVYAEGGMYALSLVGRENE